MPCGGRTGRSGGAHSTADRVHRAPRLDHAAAEQRRPGGGVGGRRGRHEPQPRPQHGPYVQQEGHRGVGVQVPFVALVEQHRAHPGQLRVPLQALQQHAGGDDLHDGARGHPPLAPHGEADPLADALARAATPSAARRPAPPSAAARRPAPARPRRTPRRAAAAPASSCRCRAAPPAPRSRGRAAPPAARARRRRPAARAPRPAARRRCPRSRQTRIAGTGRHRRARGSRPRSLLHAHEDRGTGQQPAAQRGPAAPLLGVPLAATPARPGRPAAARPRRSPGPGRRACGGARRRRPAPGRPARRKGCGRSRRRSTVRPSAPGSSGKAQRTGWVTEKTQRPPGRSTRATSRCTRARVGDERQRAVRRAGQVEASRRRRAGARVGLHQRRPRPPRRRLVSSPIRRACWSCRCDRSRATGRAPCAASQREHCAAPAPISRTSRPLSRSAGPSSRASASSSPSGPHTKRASPRKSPCSRW